MKMSILTVLPLLALITGCEGPAGADGANGTNGVDGTNGTDGADGADGADGSDGADGADGADGSDGADAPVDYIMLPGASFFPESIVAAADGTLYVTSIAYGSVLEIAPDGEITTFVPSQAVGKVGILLDEANDTIYLCTVNTTTFASTLRVYEASTGTMEEEIALTTGVCNDLALDTAGNLYITDSFVGIQRLPANSSTLESWSTNALYTAAPFAFAIDGIVLDGSNIYVNNIDSGALIRVPINSDGTAGTPVEITGITLDTPDGLRLLGPNKILVAESMADTLSQVDVNTTTNVGTRTVLSNRLDRPSSVAISGGDAWVAEGQIGRLFGSDATPVNVPFVVARVPLF